jgi:hypothetical protein
MAAAWPPSRRSPHVSIGTRQILLSDIAANTRIDLTRPECFEVDTGHLR